MKTSTRLNVNRLPEKFVSDDKRVITRFLNFGNAKRIRSILGRVLDLSDEQVKVELEHVRESFAHRHRNVESAFLNHFREVSQYLDNQELALERQLLIGAYFTLEYSIESAALFNPSVVKHPDQSGLKEGELRFLMSLRATGEGHVSSIVFRGGVLHDGGHVAFDPPPRYSYTAKPEADKRYEKKLFRRKLVEMGESESLIRAVLAPLGEHFTLAQLEDAIDSFEVEASERAARMEATVASMRWLARANYDLDFGDCPAGEMVLFPATELESRGMEDLRLVEFTDDDGQHFYFGTYTAFDGVRMVPMMLQTADFKKFHIGTLNGKYVTNKGLALFPRKVGGKYMMVARHDGENLYLLESDYLHFWNDSRPLMQPKEPWELVQIGNCGSPIETEAGWLLLTHGVGPVREYSIGAMLLDLNEPWKVIGRLREPLLEPTPEEREGYVPNVVYTCGSLVHEGELVMPYAMSDVATALSKVNVDDLLRLLIESGP